MRLVQHIVFAIISLSFTNFIVTNGLSRGRGTINGFGANGGVNCAVVTSLADQLSIIYNETIIQSLERLCNYLPSPYKTPCQDFAEFFGKLLIERFTSSESADTFCEKIGFCRPDKGKEACRIFPKPKVLDPDICKLPGIDKICHWFETIFNNHDPGVDLDGDRHSIYQTLRGTSWRGKDCNDNKEAVHPGARPVQSDLHEDSNCNGIYGTDPVSGKSYEELFCSNTQPRGVAVLGDSISAHFHLPRQWFNASELSTAVFEPLPFIAENELDWPEFSSSTEIKIAQIPYSLYREQTGDQPLIVFYALVGNDVCNGHTDTFNHMTKPEDMRKNALLTLQFLESKLPKGSHVFMVGLADGGVLYNALHDRIHPIGAVRQDVTYSDFYDYFNCLEISPCLGWMNTNETIRTLTTQWAMNLSSVLQDVVKQYKDNFTNFKLYYVDNPVNQVISEWVAKGGQDWQLLEPVDGFHSNQENHEVELNTTHADDNDWLIVDMPDKTTCNSPVQQAGVNSNLCPSNFYNTGSDTDSDATGHSPGHSSCTSGSDSPIGMSRYYIRKKIGFHESWILTPPPCFTAKGSDSSQMEISPMENLLIEHPSMSVYNSTQSRGSTGEESDISTSSNDNLSSVVARKGLRPRNERGMVMRQAPRRAQAVAARCGILAQAEAFRSSQRAKQYQESRRLTRNNLEKMNKVLQSNNKKFTQKSRINTPAIRSARFAQRQH
ncbi:hypothetical protein FSP39_022061 [Pinctada imbricata]|uniref:Saposin B-type domain-containing protein n=1 Tax=Pinctada imbricata TaxID=66713 RepID=A0AA88XK42_PINIB|nr:hypothetical protein FSP39_022061 [Pinctada imbricata]